MTADRIKSTHSIKCFSEYQQTPLFTDDFQGALNRAVLGVVVQPLHVQSGPLPLTDPDDLASFKYNSQLLKGKRLNTNEELLPGMKRTESSEFVAATGFVVDELNATSLRGHVQLGTNHHTPWGVVHGGLFTTIVESAASIGASFAVNEYGQFAVGVHNATDFLRSGSSGLALVKATALHQGRTQQLWEVIITDDASSKVLARGQLRLQNVPLPEKSTEVQG